jgi:hypothetical protein
MPEETLYDDAWLSYAVDSATPSNTFGPVHRFHDEDTAVNEAYTMTLDASGLPEDLVSKASLATVSDGGRLAYAGGSYRDGVVTGSVRAFGAFTIATDTAPPTISPINISDGKDMRRAGDIRIRVRDDFSGVSRYRGEVDGKWILFEYDAKYGLLTHTFDGHVGAGSHALRLEVEDRTGNVRVYRTRFTL